MRRILSTMSEKRSKEILVKGDRVSVTKTYFDGPEDLVPYSSYLPDGYQKICGTVEFYYWNTRKARIQWDIDGKYSDAPLEDLT